MNQKPDNENRPQQQSPYQPRTDDEIKAARIKLWGDVSLNEFSIGYRERVQSIMNRLVVNYLTALDDIEELRIQMKKENYDANQKLVDFCQSMARGKLEDCDGITETVIFKVANSIALTSQDEANVREKLAESVAKSHTAGDKTNPYKNAWFKEE